MGKLFLVVLLLGFSCNLQMVARGQTIGNPSPAQFTPQEIQAAHQRAEALIQRKNYRQAIEEYQKILATEPRNQRSLYNTACLYALLNEKSKAVEFLRKTVEAGWTDVDYMEADPDLNAIRDEAGYKEILKGLKERAAPAKPADLSRAAKLDKIDRMHQEALAKAIIPPEFREPEGGWPANPQKGFIAHVKVTAYEHPNAWFHLSVPLGYTPEKAWPLTLVLHGGPNGTPDNMSYMYRGRNLPKRTIVACVQAISPQYELNWNLPHEGANLLCIIRQIARTYRIDPYRICLTGHSMGGGGCYAQGATLCDIWACVVPMSGWYWKATNPPPKEEWRRWLKDVPVYIMHGELDKNVPVWLGRMAAQDLKEMGNTKFVYREFKGVGHDLYNEVDQADLFEMADWVYAQRRSTPPDFAAAIRKLAERGAHSGWTPEGGAIGSYRSGKPVGPYKTNEQWNVSR